ncbi:cytochrome p450 [Trichoderma arundinaceum]|uniref:Cytochrome p450 n=1 Tax=Trichoderma arundinaceum TaxID=490622 RepID=A0A395NJK6_TRIAR|nr:cytochrome p450 [Trichoderma arundinaceum]
MDVLLVRMRESGPTVWAALGAVFIAVLLRVLIVPRDSREPPYIDPKVPLIGHLISLYRDGARYFTTLDEEYNKGVYTIPIMGARMYVVGSPEWSIAVQKHWSSVDMYSLTARALKTLMGLNKASMDIIMHNLYGDKQETSDNVIFVLKDVMLKALTPGKDLDELNYNLLKNYEPRFNNLAQGGKPQKMMFWAWTRQEISEASMASAYGPDNPVAREPTLVADFWTFDATSASLMMPFPSIFARKGHLARWRFINGFVDYAVRGAYKDAATLIKVRAKESLARGIAIDQYGQMESNFAPGLLSNTVPSIFWLISRVFEDPALLVEIRAEIDQCIEEREGNKRALNVAKLQTQCPLFASVFFETLRTVSPLNNYRYVREDTVITNNKTNESYLLKKGNLVQLASTVLHARPSVWGKDADSFNSRRFLPVVNRARAGPGMDGKPIDPATPFRDANGKMHSGSFRPFGGGIHLCPGRFFAQTGVQSAAALFITGFEIESEPGKYVPPPFRNAKGFMFLSVIKPERDVEVMLKRREGFENTEWEFNLSDSSN